MRLALALLVSLGTFPAYASAITFSGTLDGRPIIAEIT